MYLGNHEEMTRNIYSAVILLYYEKSDEVFFSFYFHGNAPANKNSIRIRVLFPCLLHVINIFFDGCVVWQQFAGRFHFVYCLVEVTKTGEGRRAPCHAFRSAAPVALARWFHQIQSC